MRHDIILMKIKRVRAMYGKKSRTFKRTDNYNKR